MKTYLMDSLNRYKRFSEKLDVKTILCNKSWWVFNDSGEKEIYIFQENGSLIVSLNGNVTVANWSYIPVNKSLIINSKEQSYMLHPAFSDNNILALQKDGTEHYSFLIQEDQLNYFQPKTLSELNAYFEREIQAQIEAERRKLRAEREAEEIRLKAEKETERRRRLQELEERKRLEKERRIEEAIEKNKIYQIVNTIFFLQIFITPIVIFVYFYRELYEGICQAFNSGDISEIIGAIIGGIFIPISSGLMIYIVIFVMILVPIQSRIRKRIEKDYN